MHSLQWSRVPVQLTRPHRLPRPHRLLLLFTSTTVLWLSLANRLTCAHTRSRPLVYVPTPLLVVVNVHAHLYAPLSSPALVLRPPLAHARIQPRTCPRTRSLSYMPLLTPSPTLLLTHACSCTHPLSLSYTPPLSLTLASSFTITPMTFRTATPPLIHGHTLVSDFIHSHAHSRTWPRSLPYTPRLSQPPTPTPSHAATYALILPRLRIHSLPRLTTTPSPALMPVHARWSSPATLSCHPPPFSLLLSSHFHSWVSLSSPHSSFLFTQHVVI
jgi:hypothetical protein